MGIRPRVVIRCGVGIFMLDNLCLGGEDRGVLDGGVWDCCMVEIFH